MNSRGAANWRSVPAADSCSTARYVHGLFHRNIGERAAVRRAVRGKRVAPPLGVAGISRHCVWHPPSLIGGFVVGLTTDLPAIPGTTTRVFVFARAITTGLFVRHVIPT
jgi:hypothetical protein